MASQQPIPSTRVTAPSPTPSETNSTSYFAPITRSATKRSTPRTSNSAISEASDSDSSISSRARSRSRSPSSSTRRLSNSTKRKTRPRKSSAAGANASAQPPPGPIPEDTDGEKAYESNGHLSPPKPSYLSPDSSSSTTPASWWDWLGGISGAGNTGAGASRTWSPTRSPSPLGLIPIHRHFRSFVHKHEIPRKALHLSIGALTLYLYARGVPASSIHPVLLTALVPVASMDLLRHHVPAVNRVYVRCLGALMRESEVEGYNGVIWYLLGAWTVLRWYPKDVAVMSVLLLSWCDTAASTVGRVWGRYTVRLRRGKSLAGSVAACVTGVATAWVFWGWVVPRWRWDEGFLFNGSLRLPETARGLIGGSEGISAGEEAGQIGGWVALGIVSLWSGVVGAASEVVDLFGWDDNATIPILSGLGLWGFFKVFAA